MANMSYCRFENTAKDLQDCFNHWYDENPDNLNEYEQKGRERIIKLAKRILEDEGYEIQKEEEH